MKLPATLSCSFCLLAGGALLMLATSNADAQATRSRSTTQITAAKTPSSTREAQYSPEVTPVPSKRENTAPAKDRSGHREPANSQRKNASKAKESPNTTANAKVYDRQGRHLSGYKQVGPNRVLDTRTGRYHDTAQMSDGQRLID